jgi:hypothetical protein
MNVTSTPKKYDASLGVSLHQRPSSVYEVDHQDAFQHRVCISRDAQAGSEADIVSSDLPVIFPYPRIYPGMLEQGRHRFAQVKC